MRSLEDTEWQVVDQFLLAAFCKMVGLCSDCFNCQSLVIKKLHNLQLTTPLRLVLYLVLIYRTQMKSY